MSDKSNDLLSPPMLSSMSLGESLVAARKSKGLSVEDIVRETRIAADSIRALEGNVYQAFRSTTFVRGYLKQYANCVELDEHAVMHAYNLWLDQHEQKEATVRPPRQVKRWDARNTAMGLSFVVAITATVSWLYSVREPVISNQRFSDTLPLSAPERLGVLAHNVLGSIELPTLNAGVVPPNASTQKIDQNDTDQLEVQLLGDSWLVVNDRDGRELYRDLARAGKAVELAGRSPFSVLMGYAPGVRLTLNGEPFAIEAIRRDNTARVLVQSR